MQPLALAVLRQLSGGGFHSGAAIARRLGVSRGTVWNAVHAAEQAGARIFKLRGRGYCLAEPVEWLDRARILAAAGRAGRALTLEILDEAESTNTLLLERAAAGAPHGTVLAAEWQSRGRGRRGRPWHSDLGGALTFSMLWRFPQGAGALSGLSLAVGLALAQALEDLGLAGAQLKWPNDLLFRWGKLAGVLIEIEGDMLGPSTVVIGVGVNLRVSAATRARVDQAVADIAAMAPEPPGRNALLGAMLRRLAGTLEAFGRDGFAPFRAEWQRRHACHGKAVTLSLPDGRQVAGTVVGVGEDGALLLKTASGTHGFAGGEISLRRA